MRYGLYGYPNRTLCDVLAEMTKACETLNFSILPGLIVEAQTMGNRMEAALEDGRDVEIMKEDRRRLRKELAELEKKKEELENG